MRNVYKTLEAIEYLVSDDFGMEMEFIDNEKKFPKELDKERLRLLKEAARRITTIYQIAHAENSKGCKHPDWEEIKYKVIKEYSKSQ